MSNFISLILTLSSCRVNDMLAEKGSRFLTGETLCCFDCELMPKLQHVRVAGMDFQPWQSLCHHYHRHFISFMVFITSEDLDPTKAVVRCGFREQVLRDSMWIFIHQWRVIHHHRILIKFSILIMISYILVIFMVIITSSLIEMLEWLIL